MLAAVLIRYKQKISIHELINAFSSNTFPITFLILAIPSALPIPAVGYSTPFGLAILLIAMQFIFRRKALCIPKFIQRYEIPTSIVKKALSPILLIMGFLEKNFPQQKRNLSHKLPVILIALLSIIMAIPIPFTNTIPAIGISLLAIAMIHNNRNILHIASAIATFILLTYSALFYFAFCIGSSLINQLFCR